MTQEFRTKFAAARRAVIAQRYRKLNPRQLEAVLATEGPLLLLAGAGSGKTTVLIHRVDNLLTFGRGSDTDEVPDCVNEDDLAFLESFPKQPSLEDWKRAIGLCAVEPAAPWSVIAITFTNKAAGELKERLERMCGPAARDIWAATFHSACVRILRRDVERMGLGLDSRFTIYDTEDSKRVIRDIIKDMEKDRSPDQFAQDCKTSRDWRMPRIAEIYSGYQRRLLEANAVDFDDIIRYTVHLLQGDEEVRAYYQRKFRYVLVDEYQDTNHLQYQLSRLLAGGRDNLCVVGDDDQSIYRFRGADLENILSFERQYDHCRTIRLEQNYRSTQNILDAANGVIRNNVGRKGKNLWTDSGKGEKVQVRTVTSESDEASFVAGKVMESISRGGHWRDNAVLYRMNAQSNAIEMALKRNGVPYKVYGGMKFFDRAEVKDMLSYLWVISNSADDLRLRRVVNVPARGIGPTTLEKAAQIAAQEGRSLFDVMEHSASYPAIRSASVRLVAFTSLIHELAAMAGEMELPDFYDAVCEKSGYTKALEEKNDMESRGRLENVKELRSSIVGFLDTAPEDPSLAGFLDSVALYTDLDDANENDDAAVMMTMHAAKGLEFANVFLVGFEDGLFPGMRAIGDPEEMEEERRLCYVAITRAKKTLTITHARQRMLYGRTSTNQPSRFLEEVPEESILWQGREDAARSAAAWAHDPGLSGAVFSRSGSAAPRPESAVAPRPAPSRRPAKVWNSGYTASAAKAAPLPELSSGDSVRHRTFGEGMVLSVKPMGNDALIEIAFTDVGTKRLMLRSAKEHLTKL